MGVVALAYLTIRVLCLAEARPRCRAADGRRGAHPRWPAGQYNARAQLLTHQVDNRRYRRSSTSVLAAPRTAARTTRSDLDALGHQLRGEIRDLARALKEVQSPLPRILAMTCEVREGVGGIQKAQGHTGEALERLERASESLAMTTDYLVAIAEEDEDGEDDERFGDDADDVADTALEVVANDADADDGADEDAPEAAIARAAAGSDTWQAEFERLEEAWLVGRTVGDSHETLKFLPLVSDLRLNYDEPSEIIAAFDRFRVRAGGDRFSYCPLHGAVHLVRMRKPSLDNGLVLVRYRELARLRPCTGLQDCPGIAEVLSRSR
jgi:hypothetical protein